MRAPRRFLGQADLRQLRIAVGDPGQRARIERRRQPEQGAADHQPGLMPSDMGEGRAAVAIADRIDPAVGGAQAGIDLEYRLGEYIGIANQQR